MSLAERKQLVSALEYAITTRVSGIDGNTCNLDTDESEQEEFYLWLKDAHNWRLLRDKIKQKEKP